MESVTDNFAAQNFRDPALLVAVAERHSHFAPAFDSRIIFKTNNRLHAESVICFDVEMGGIEPPCIKKDTVESTEPRCAL